MEGHPPRLIAFEQVMLDRGLGDEVLDGLRSAIRYERSGSGSIRAGRSRTWRRGSTPSTASRPRHGPSRAWAGRGIGNGRRLGRQGVRSGAEDTVVGDCSGISNGGSTRLVAWPRRAASGRCGMASGTPPDPGAAAEERPPGTPPIRTLFACRRAHRPTERLDGLGGKPKPVCNFGFNRGDFMEIRPIGPIQGLHA